MKRKIAITGIIISTILILLYISLRAGMIEEEYLKILIPRNEKIAVNLSAYEKNKPLNEKNLASFLDIVTKKFPDIAVFAVSDLNGRLLVTGKNDLYIDKEQFNRILQQFSTGELKVYPKSSYLIRYFNQVKYYIFVKELNDGRMMVMFPYSLRGKLLIKLLMELFLLLILSVVFTTAFYLYIRRSGRGLQADTVSVGFPLEPGPISVPADKPRAGIMPSPAAESLNPEVTRLFSRLSEEHSAETIALYVVQEETGDLVKIYELKGKTFLRIDTPGFDRLDISAEVRDELSRRSTLMLDVGRTIVIPLLHRDVLPAVLRLSRSAAFSGREIDDITRLSMELAEPIYRTLHAG